MTVIVPTHEQAPQVTMPPELVPGEQLTSSAALSALRTYAEAVNDGTTLGENRAYEHPLRVATILHDFVGEKISSDAYDAAALHDVAQRIDPWHKEQEAAFGALRSYAAFAGPRTWEYTSTLLADMGQIEVCSQEDRYSGNSTRDELVTALLTSESDEAIPQHAWSMPSGLADLNGIEGLLQNVNIESILIKAAEMLDNLKYPAPNDRAVLQDVFDAESFYAPLCEAIGFDGLSMALRSASACIRLQKSGNLETLAEAQDILTTLGDRNQVLSDIAGLFEHLLGSSISVDTPLSDKSGHGIMLGHSTQAVHELNGEAIPSEIRWREKSLGSLALKLAKFNNPSGTESGEAKKVPGDVLGITIIVDDMKALTMTYRGLVECIKRNNVVQEHPAPGRAEAYSIQGSKEYIRTVRNSLKKMRLVRKRELEEVPKDNGHQVVKATFLYMPHLVTPDRPEVAIPVELQIQTEADWKESRTGSAAHLLYKAGTYGDHRILAVIKKRRDNLNSGNLNPASTIRGGILRSKLSLVA